MKAVTPQTTEPYVCKRERELPEAEQTVFNIKPLTVAEEAYIEDQLGRVQKGGDFAVNLGSQSLMALHLGLASVDNLQGGDLKRDNTAHPIHGKTQPWSNRSLSLIPRWARSEVAQYIINGKELQEDEVKN